MGSWVYSRSKPTQQSSAWRMLHARQILTVRDLEHHGFKSDIPKAPNNYLMCSQAHMVEMGLKTNFLWAKLLTANRDTELMQLVLPGPYHGSLANALKDSLVEWTTFCTRIWVKTDQCYHRCYPASVWTQEADSVVVVYFRGRSMK